MFTLIEILGPSYNMISLALSVFSDCIFIGALLWAHKKRPEDDR